MNSLTTCPGCGLQLPDKKLVAPEGYNASGECYELYMELTYFTLSLGDTYFIHQSAVDAYGAQHTGPTTKNIRTVFALMGLYLEMERNYTGKQVQQVHMIIPKQEWPRLTPPLKFAALTVADVMKVNTDTEKEHMIKKWEQAVWDNWQEHQDWIRKVTEEYLLD